MFYEDELQKANQKEFRIEKVIERQDDKLYIKWKGCNNLTQSQKEDIVEMIECFLELESLGIVKVELDLSNYATKTDVKNETGIDTSSFAKKFDLPNLKSNVDKLDLHELKNVPTN